MLQMKQNSEECVMYEMDVLQFRGNLVGRRTGQRNLMRFNTGKCKILQPGEE